MAASAASGNQRHGMRARCRHAAHASTGSATAACMVFRPHSAPNRIAPANRMRGGGRASSRNTSQASTGNSAIAGNSVCMPPARAMLNGRLPSSATAHQRRVASPPSAAASANTAAAAIASHSPFNAPRASLPASSCAAPCSTSPAHGASAHTCRFGSIA